jgi:hypothetical protein
VVRLAPVKSEVRPLAPKIVPPETERTHDQRVNLQVP